MFIIIIFYTYAIFNYIEQQQNKSVVCKSGKTINEISPKLMIFQLKLKFFIM